MLERTECKRLVLWGLVLWLLAAACSAEPGLKSTAVSSIVSPSEPTKPRMDVTPTFNAMAATSQAKTALPPTFTALAGTSLAAQLTRENWTEIPITPTAAASPTSTLSTLTPEVEPGIELEKIAMFGSIGWAETNSEGNQDRFAGNIWRTVDGGQTWSRILPELDDVRLIEAISAKVAWVAECRHTERGCQFVLSQTRDGGQTWQELSGDISLIASTLNFFNEDDGVDATVDMAAGSAFLRLQETHDGGLTWSSIEFQKTHQGESIDEPWGYHLCGICGDVYYFDFERFIVVGGNLANNFTGRVSLWITRDRGGIWRELELELPKGPFRLGWVQPNSPKFYDEENGVLPLILKTQDFSRSAVAFYRTTDGGSNWQFLSLVEVPDESRRRISIEVPTVSDIFFGCGLSLCVSQDGGATWRKLSTPFAWAPNPEQPYVEAFNFSNATNGWALVGQVDSTLWKSGDGGSTWEQIYPQFLPSR